MGSAEKAKDGSGELNHRAAQSSRDLHRSAEVAGSTFKSTNESQLGSGRTTVPEPAQATGGGTLELTMTTMIGLTATLGSFAAAAFLGRRHHS